MGTRMNKCLRKRPDTVPTFATVRYTFAPSRSTVCRAVTCLGVCWFLNPLGPLPTAQAQIRGMPVHFSPSAQPGIRLHGDFAGGDDPFETYFGGRATINLSLVTIAGGVGSLDDEVVWGGTLSANVLRGAARNFSLSVDGGFGVNDVDGRTTHEIPLGLGIAYEATMTGVDLEPWIGLRAHIRRTAVEELTDEPYSTRVGAGVSAGVNARSVFINNFGLHLAVDYLTITQPFGEGRDKTFLFNIGLNYLIPLSGLPPHGIIGASCSPFDPC